MPELVGAQFPFGSGAVWLQSIHGRLSQEDRTQFRWTHWSYGVEVLCGFTDGEHEIRKSKHMWTDDLEPVQMLDTERSKVIAMMLVILE